MRKLIAVFLTHFFKATESVYAAIHNQRYCHYDYSDASLRIAIMSEDAKFGHEHVQITDIEFAALEEDDPRKQLLECTGSLVRGED